MNPPKRSTGVAAVVPIKTRNVRLPGKNTRPLGGLPLFRHLLDRVAQSELFDAVYIDSSDRSMLTMAADYGFRTIERPVHLDGPEISGNDLLRFEMDYVGEPTVAQLFVTLPFLEMPTVAMALEVLRTRDDVDSVVPVYPIHDRFWFDERPVSHEASQLVGTQFQKPVHREAGFYVFRRDAFLREGSRVCARRAFVEVDERQCIDIDDEFDFFYAEQWLAWQRAKR